MAVCGISSHTQSGSMNISEIPGGWIFRSKVCLLFRFSEKRRSSTPLSTDELNRILEQIDLTKTKGKRNLAIILLGAELGLRVSDIINLKITDVDWLRKELHIQGRFVREQRNLCMQYYRRSRPSVLELSWSQKKVTQVCGMGDSSCGVCFRCLSRH